MHNSYSWLSFSNFVTPCGPLLSVNWKVVGTSCKLKSCKGVFGVQLARSEDSTVLTTETSQESSFVNVILFLMFAFRLLRSFATWFGAEWPKSNLQAGYFAVTLAKSNMQDVPTTFQFTLLFECCCCMDVIDLPRLSLGTLFLRKPRLLYEVDHCTAFRPCSTRHMTPTSLLVCVGRNRY